MTLLFKIYEIRRRVLLTLLLFYDENVSVANQNVRSGHKSKTIAKRQRQNNNNNSNNSVIGGHITCATVRLLAFYSN